MCNTVAILPSLAFLFSSQSLIYHFYKYFFEGLAFKLSIIEYQTVNSPGHIGRISYKAIFEMERDYGVLIWKLSKNDLWPLPLSLVLSEASWNTRRDWQCRREILSCAYSSIMRVSRGVMRGIRLIVWTSLEPRGKPCYSVTTTWPPGLSYVWGSGSASLVQALSFGGTPTFLSAGHQVQVTESSSTETGEGHALWPHLSHVYSSVPLGIKATYWEAAGWGHRGSLWHRTK